MHSNTNTNTNTVIAQLANASELFKFIQLYWPAAAASKITRQLADLIRLRFRTAEHATMDHRITYDGSVAAVLLMSSLGALKEITVTLDGEDEHPLPTLARLYAARLRETADDANSPLASETRDPLLIAQYDGSGFAHLFEFVHTYWERSTADRIMETVANVIDKDPVLSKLAHATFVFNVEQTQHYPRIVITSLALAGRGVRMHLDQPEDQPHTDLRTLGQAFEIPSPTEPEREHAEVTEDALHGAITVVTFHTADGFVNFLSRHWRVDTAQSLAEKVRRNYERRSVKTSIWSCAYSVVLLADRIAIVMRDIGNPESAPSAYLLLDSEYPETDLHALPMSVAYDGVHQQALQGNYAPVAVVTNNYRQYTLAEFRGMLRTRIKKIEHEIAAGRDLSSQLEVDSGLARFAAVVKGKKTFVRMYAADGGFRVDFHYADTKECFSTHRIHKFTAA